MFFMGQSPTRLALARWYLYAMLLRRVAFLRALSAPVQPPSRPWVAARDQTRGLPNAGAPRCGRLFTRNGHDWTGRFLLIARAGKVASCLIEGEAVACDNNGLPVFDRLRCR